MRGQGIAPVTQHFVTFLGACCGAPLSARETRQAFGRALAFCVGAGGDCSVYAALLKFCVAQDIPEKAADVWRAIVKVRSLPQECHPLDCAPLSLFQTLLTLFDHKGTPSYTRATKCLGREGLLDTTTSKHQEGCWNGF